jgi:hypothetical protein
MRDRTVSMETLSLTANNKSMLNSPYLSASAGHPIQLLTYSQNGLQFSSTSEPDLDMSSATNNNLSSSHARRNSSDSSLNTSSCDGSLTRE